jgi:hypothetical protein
VLLVERVDPANGRYIIGCSEAGEPASHLLQLIVEKSSFETLVGYVEAE